MKIKYKKEKNRPPPHQLDIFSILFLFSALILLWHRNIIPKNNLLCSQPKNPHKRAGRRRAKWRSFSTFLLFSSCCLIFVLLFIHIEKFSCRCCCCYCCCIFGIEMAKAIREKNINVHIAVYIDITAQHICGEKAYMKFSSLENVLYCVAQYTFIYIK